MMDMEVSQLEQSWQPNYKEQSSIKNKEKETKARKLHLFRWHRDLAITIKMEIGIVGQKQTIDKTISRH